MSSVTAKGRAHPEEDLNMANYEEIKKSLDQLSKDELEKLQKDVQRAHKSVDERTRREARQRAEEAVKEFGYNLNDLVDGGSSKGGKRPANPPKYRHPENPEKTWTGRGRQPAWVKQHVEDGGDLEDLLIDKAA